MHTLAQLSFYSGTKVSQWRKDEEGEGEGIKGRRRRGGGERRGED